MEESTTQDRVLQMSWSFILEFMGQKMVLETVERLEAPRISEKNGLLILRAVIKEVVRDDQWNIIEYRTVGYNNIPGYWKRCSGYPRKGDYPVYDKTGKQIIARYVRIFEKD